MALAVLVLVFLAMLGLQGLVYQRYWDRNLEVALAFSVPVAAEGAVIRLEETITSRKALPLPWLAVKFQVSRHLRFPDGLHAAVTDDYYREDLFSLGLYQRIVRTLAVDLRKRGYYVIKSIDLVSGDLLLTRKFVGHAESRSVLTVTPRLIPRQDLEIPYRQLMGTVLVRTAHEPDPFEFRTIREYQDFDSLRSVNWPATARTGQLKVNVREFTATCEVRILLCVQPDGPFPDDDLMEEGIRMAASLGTLLSEDGIAVSLLTDGRDAVTGAPAEVPAGRSGAHVARLQEQLGRLDLGKKPADFAALLSDRIPGWSRDPILLLISADCGPRIRSAWDRCLSDGFHGLWIVPEYDDRPGRRPMIEGPVVPWEVRRHGG